MPFQINAENTEIIVTSTLVSEMLVAPGSHELILEAQLNCGTEYQVTYTPASNTYRAQSLIVKPEDFGMEEQFTGGVYKLRLIRRNLVTDLREDIRGCLFADADIRCLIVEYYAKNYDRRVPGYHAALLGLQHCGKCVCEEACLVYQQLLELLNDEGNDGCDCEQG